MHISSKLIPFFFVLVLIAGNLSPTPVFSATPWQDKVDPWVFETAAEGETEFLVFLAEQADLSRAGALRTKLEKGTYVYETLSALAERTQEPILAELERLRVEHRSYWVANMIWVRGNVDVVQAMAERPDVAHVYANPWVKMEEPAIEAGTGGYSPSTIEWNISKVNADDLWNLGYTGQGAVIAGQDTGYKWDHAALINQYRGWESGSADHNYNWHDAIHSGGGSCGPDSLFPCDDHGHGTHTMGTMVGDDGGANQIGMAPGARWIGCRNMDQGNGTPTTYSECYQWFIAPTDLNDENPDPSMAPDVINNSWGCPPSEGCTDPNVLLTVVQNVVAAGILTAHSAGNSGSGCSTVNTPAAIYDESYTVGATNSSDDIAGFSSRGPVTVDGSNRLKPDISAPGVNIRSSTRDGGYQGGWQGTSMAAPHVAGLVGLLISANPSLAGNVDMLEDLINAGALPRTSGQTCGGIPGTQIPNPIYGWGRIDALASYNSMSSNLSLEKSAAVPAVAPGSLLTYTLTVTHTNLGGFATTNLVLTDTLPADTTFVDATEPYLIVGGDTVQWEYSTVPADVAKTVDLVVQVNPDAASDIVNDKYGTRSDDVPTILGDPVETTLVPYALSIEKTAPEWVGPGELITYTLSASNLNYLATTYNLVLTDVLPADTTFVSASEPYSLTGDVFTWESPSLDPSQDWQVQLIVQAPESFIGTITNSDYGVRSDEVAPVLGAPVETQVIGLSVDKSADEWVEPGDLLTYTLSVQNLHPSSPNHDIILMDTLPAGTTFISATEPYSLNVDVVTWENPLLGSGETWQVELVVGVPVTATSTIENTSYSVYSDEVPTAFMGEAVSTLVAQRSLLLVPDHTQAASPGEVVVYTHTISNTGNIPDTYTITLSSSLGWSSVDLGQISLDPGQSGTVTVTVQVPADAIGGKVETGILAAISQADDSVTGSAMDKTIVKGNYRSYLPVVTTP